jgi:glucose-fructose oxidoreductase
MRLPPLLLALPLFTSLLSAAPLRVAVIGLEHGHVSGFLNGGGALVPAGGALHRPDIQVVGIVEPKRDLFDRYADRLHLDPQLYFSSISAMAAKVHPDAALVFTSTAGHTAAVLECAHLHIHVMMEKPLAVSYRDAQAMAQAARANNIHVLVDYETTWYASNKAAYDLFQSDAPLGPVRKAVVRDGHEGPQKIHVQPEFFHILTDPKLNGAGALYDFGCYGADLMTWLMHGERPVSVSATVGHFQPSIYPNVDDESDVLVNYKNAVAILQGSWNWPFAVKNMDVYGVTGYVKTIARDQIEVQREKEKQPSTHAAKALAAPDDDPLHYLAAVLHGEVSDTGTLSSLDTNVIVSQILDAARTSAREGRTVLLK